MSLLRDLRSGAKVVMLRARGALVLDRGSWCTKCYENAGNGEMTRTRRPNRIEEATPPRALEVSRFDSTDGEMVVLAFPIEEGDLALTPAEHEVVTAIEAGMSNAAIARARGTSTRTVANQVASIFKKLKVGSRAELVATRAVLREGGEPEAGG